MGMETAALMLAIAGGAEVGKSVMEIQAANAKEKALDLQAKETQLQTQQKTLNNYDVMEKVNAAQIAHMTTTGLSFSSPSFNAIQRDSFNTGAKAGKNIEIEGELQQENIKLEKQNVESTLYAQLFGNVSNVAMAGQSYASKMPTRTT